MKLLICLLLIFGSTKAQTFVQAQSSNNGSGGVPATITGLSFTSGNMLEVTGYFLQDCSTRTFSFSGPFTTISGYIGTDYPSQQWCSAKICVLATSTGAATISVNTSVIEAFVGASVAEWHGTQSTCDSAANSNAGATSTTVTSASLNTTYTNEVVSCSMLASGVVSVGAMAGVTATLATGSNNFTGFGIEYRIFTSKQTGITAAYTSGTSGNMIIQCTGIPSSTQPALIKGSFVGDIE